MRHARGTKFIEPRYLKRGFWRILLTLLIMIVIVGMVFFAIIAPTVFWNVLKIILWAIGIILIIGIIVFIGIVVLKGVEWIGRK